MDLKNFRRIQTRFSKSKPYTTREEVKTDPSSDPLDQDPPVNIFHIIDTAEAIGNVVFNLRAALDHLAWQLVLADGSTPDRNTQFPIRDSTLNKQGKVVPTAVEPSIDPCALAQSRRCNLINQVKTRSTIPRVLRDLNNTTNIAYFSWA